MTDSHSDNTRRIAKNTLALYVRMLFGMLVSLYTSRVILNALGVVDFGIQNVVGGVVGMFALLSGSLSAAISRFLTFELGTKNEERLAKIFSTSLVVQVFLATIIVILLETVGVWILNTKMVIPPERMFAANCVLQFSIASFAINLISMPYNASIVSHEHMTVFAYIGVGEIIARLLIVLSLKIIPESYDKLIYFSILTFCLMVIIQIIYWLYCKHHFKECRFKLYTEKTLLKEILGFASWNFIGASSAILRDQGGNVILNLFWGPTVNAARGIGQQVSNAVGAFVNNFMVALNPQITKSYASGDYNYTFSLIYRATRFSYYVMFIIALPILFNSNFIIGLWLGQIPEHVILFVKLTIIFSLCETISNPLVTVMLATGKIRNYQIIVGGLQMLNLPISYILLRIGSIPEIVMIVAISLSLSCLVARLIMLRKMIGLSVRKYLNNVLLRIAIVTILSVIIPCVVTRISNETLMWSIVSILICIMASSIVVYFIGCSINEQRFIREKATTVFNKVIHR